MGTIDSAETIAHDKAIDYAAREGASDGIAAASWVEIDETNAARILAMLDAGDPAVWDILPSADLSGQWANERTGPQLVEEALDAADIDTEDVGGFESDARADATEYWFSDICDEYETAFSQSVEDEISRRCRIYI